MNFIDLKYAGILSTRLEQYTIKNNSPYRANLRCPVCGDSQKSKTKARGWILDKDNKGWYYCHNCGISMNLGKFIEFINPSLYTEYVADTLLEKKAFEKPKKEVKPLDKLKMKAPNFRKNNSPLLKLKKISSLSPNHYAKKYIEQRKIPTHQHYRLYFAENFNAWVNTIIPKKLDERYDEPRLVTPFIDKSGNLFGFAGRSFEPNAYLRYITIMIDEDKPKVFGIDQVDFTKPYFVVEGQLDALFISNCVAMAGADGNSEGLDYISNATYVFDNEPRNKEIVRRMEKVLKKGQKVVIWPDKFIDKDINDMVLSGLTPLDIEMILDQHTYSGLEGNLRLSTWRKC